MVSSSPSKTNMEAAATVGASSTSYSSPTSQQQQQSSDTSKAPSSSSSSSASTTTRTAAATPVVKKKNPLQHLIAGGCAGLVESSVCHPLDTIKTRMQLRRQAATLEAVRARSSLHEPGLRRLGSLREPPLSRTTTTTTTMTTLAADAAAAGTGTGTGASSLHKGTIHEPGSKLTPSSAADAAAASTIKHVPHHQPGTVSATLGPIGTARRIIQREGFFALYKGLTAVYTGIIPKMAIRFVSFEQYRELFTAFSVQVLGTAPPPPDAVGPARFTPAVTFMAGLASGLTEAVLVVTPAEVCKIRMQSQYNSLVDPTQLKHRKYTNVLQTAVTIVREEGLGALYKGVVPTMLRQGCNQAVNFSTYQYFKKKVLEYQGGTELLHWQSLLLGGISGGFGPMVNNPLDVVKTRMQKQVVHPGKEPKYKGIVQSCIVIAKEEGSLALWKGITPRLLRIMPGQAITFMTYEAVSSRLHRYGLFH